MKLYLVATDMLEDVSLAYYIYWHVKRKKFFLKVWLLKKVIRLLGFGVLHEVLGLGEISAYTMFYGPYLGPGRRGKPLI